MLDSILKQECDLQFFHDKGFVRKKCKSCGAYFWTLNSGDKFCGDRPCVEFSFIDNPITKKTMSLREVRNHFITFFTNHGHSQVFYPETGHRCPVIARWRTDIYLTIASIADFQPHVTSGLIPPPENPLVVSQPCIRLNDLEEVGVSGRHLTMFEMMGHHAFNKNIDEIYWKEETISYCDEFFQKNIGIPCEKITYKEHLWVGGGNAGPCIEVIAGGLEIATLVFMNMKEDSRGNINLNGITYIQNPLNIVDTGYGLERIAWFTSGTPTIYETVFPTIINNLLEHTSKNADMKRIYSLADHSKCLAFMLGDGIIPSNIKAGYLARLIIRRALRFMDALNLDISLSDLVTLQLNLLSEEFPSLKKRESQIQEVLTIETQRFKETITKGKNLVKRILKEKKSIATQELITLYDTHGMPPDVVRNIAKDQDVQLLIPDHFDSMIAELHSHEKEERTEGIVEKKLPPTKPLYYDDHYQQQFTAKVMWKKTTEDGTSVVLNKTTFYPEGGGQPADKGVLLFSGQSLPVVRVYKEGEAIIHVVDGDLDVGDRVEGKIDWDHRYTLMKHHTGTHVVNGALRTLLGEHIWQAGSQLSTTEARFDFSHYKPITKWEIIEIEKLANMFIQQEIPVEKKIMNRNDAERAYGFRLYQGGVPPGDCLRVLHIPGLDVEACGGTHLNNIKEVEKIHILKTERIQDGVNRVIFAAGKMADQYHKQEVQVFDQLLEILNPIYIIDSREQIHDQLLEASRIFSVPEDQLEKTLRRFLRESERPKKKMVSDLPSACQDLFETWKISQKQKKIVDSSQITQMKKQATSIPGTDYKVIAASTETEATSTAGAIIKEPDYIAHIYDGSKITSAASENVSIDLRKIAPEIGKILGGSGGGTSRLTQSGGPEKKNAKKALEKAKALTIQILRK
jgi:alanyl-tRNA synthetase